MFFLELFFENLKYLFFLLPIFMFISFFVLKYFFKIDAVKFFKSELKKQKENKQNNIEIEIVDDEKKEKKNFVVKDDIESEDIKNELKQIKEQLETDDGPIMVDFTKAIYILKHWKNYNMFSNEDGKVIFQKLQEQINSQTGVSEELSREMSELEQQPLNNDVPNFEKKIEQLEDGKYKISTSCGYTIVKEGVVIESVEFNKLEAAKENLKIKHEASSEVNELKTKVDEYEQAFLDNEKKIKDEKKAKRKKIKEEEKKEEEEFLNKFTEKKENSQETKEENAISQIDSLLKIYEDKAANSTVNPQETKNEKTHKRKQSKAVESEKTEKNDAKKEENTTIKNDANEDNEQNKDKNDANKEILSTIEEPNDSKVEAEYEETSFEPKKLLLCKELEECEKITSQSSAVFVFENFEEKYNPVIELFVHDLLNPDNLIDEKNSLVFVDLVLDEQILYIDVYLFLRLFAKLHDNEEMFIQNFLNSDESIDLNKTKRLFEKINNLYDDDFKLLLTKGRLKDFVMQRNLKIKFGSNEIKQSMQMLMIQCDINKNDVFEKINNIKENVILKHKATPFKLDFNVEINDVVSITNKSFI
jgi:hypothetical protein